MFLAGKVGFAGIVFILLTLGISGRPRPAPLTSGTDLRGEVPAHRHRTDVKKMQETLQGKGHYRGEVDGIFGLRTSASVRAYQNAQHLPVTGQIDTQTADKLGVSPEGQEESGHETTQGKPSAGIKMATGSRRTGKTQRKAVKTVPILDSERGCPSSKLHARETPEDGEDVTMLHVEQFHADGVLVRDGGFEC